MKIAINLDTITATRESIEFFEILTHLLIPDPEYRIVILTNREPETEQQVADELYYLGIEFFEILTHLLIPDLDYQIVILTDREPGTEQEVADELDYLGIEYNEIVITADKVDYIRDNNITIYFENEDFSFSAEKLIGKKTVKMANG